MQNKHTTTDKQEAKEKEKIYLSKQNMAYLNLREEKIKRCKYCIGTMPRSRKERATTYYNKGYCSLWCYEMDNPPRIDKVCEICGMAVSSIKRKNGTKAGVYPRYHKECKEKAWEVAKKNNVGFFKGIELLKKELSKKPLLDRMLDTLSTGLSTKQG